jgi:hypothetical protein
MNNGETTMSTELFCRLPDSASTMRKWNGDDRTDRPWPKQWRDRKITEDMLSIRLTWADAEGENRRLVGCFLLNMGELERLGYVEPNLKGGGQRILCFVHEEDRGIYIAARPGSSKRLLIGIY